jgi:hypothetical protein
MILYPGLTVPCCDLCIVAKRDNPNVMLVEIESEILALMDRIQTRSVPDPGAATTSDNHDDVEADSNTVCPKHPGPRRQDRLNRCRDALTSWRCTFWEQNYGSCAFGPRVLMSDAVITKLATRSHLQTVEDVQREIPEWDFAEELGANALAIIKEADNVWIQEHERELHSKRPSDSTYVGQAAKHQKHESEVCPLIFYQHYVCGSI